MTYDIPPWTPDPDFWKINGPEEEEDGHPDGEGEDLS